MFNSQPRHLLPSVLFNNAHSQDFIAQEGGLEALPLDALKALETQYQRRGLLPKPSREPFFPLWFMAETERNVFLWRSGNSLTRKNDFDFWVNVDALIAKRLDQLAEAEDEAQFFSSGFGLAVLDRDSALREREYLLSLAGLIDRVRPHVCAFARAGLIVEKEIVGPVRPRRLVTLPAGHQAAETDDYYG